MMSYRANLLSCATFRPSAAALRGLGTSVPGRFWVVLELEGRVPLCMVSIAWHSQGEPQERSVGVIDLIEHDGSVLVAMPATLPPGAARLVAEIWTRDGVRMATRDLEVSP